MVNEENIWKNGYKDFIIEIYHNEIPELQSRKYVLSRVNTQPSNSKLAYWKEHY